MTYKTLLVHMHDQSRAGRLLQAAVPLARGAGAHLIGLAVLPPVVVVPSMDGFGTSATFDEHRTAYQAEMAALKAMFAEATRDLPSPAEWREADAGFDSAAGIIIEHARTVDLLIACEKDPAWAHSTTLEAPERLAIECGRPVLLVPNSGKVAFPPKRITVAWNGRREAARATFDALPLLQAADDVDVVWIDPERDQPSAGDVPAGEICVALARHDVKCQASRASAPDGNAGAELLRQAGAFGADLLVMGAYGHSRLTELVLGGASRHVLGHMTLPILMSH